MDTLVVFQFYYFFKNFLNSVQLGSEFMCILIYGKCISFLFMHNEWS